MTGTASNWHPTFSAEEMAETNILPTIRIGKFVYTGRLHSAPEWFAWNEQLQALKEKVVAGTATNLDLLAFYHSYFRDIFAPGFFRTGVPFWAPDVADSLLKEPLATIEEAFQRFFARQARANGVVIPMAPSRPETDGTSSSQRIPEPAATTAAGG